MNYEGRRQSDAQHLARARRLVGRRDRPDGAAASVDTARLTTLDEAAHAIRAMQIRGAPLIGATAAYGICLALRADASDESLERAYATLIATRPTAINLKWALDEMVAAVRNRPRAERSAAAYARRRNLRGGHRHQHRHRPHGLPLIEAVAARKKTGERVNVLTHCNAGWLAAVDVGTATAPIYLAHDKGVAVHVFADETRPRNQGASLTAWELGQHGVPHTVIADNTGGHLMQHGLVDLVIVGTDRVTANGDVCNKIGTYLKALAARDNNVPFYVALPSPTIDFHGRRRRRRDSDRGTQRRRGGDHDRARRRRPHRDRAHRARRLAGGELRLRRDAGAAGDRLITERGVIAASRRRWRGLSRSAPARQNEPLASWLRRGVRGVRKLACRPLSNLPLPGILAMSLASLAAPVPVDGRQSPTALAIARGTARFCMRSAIAW
jgi:S-methyl-5-thioribose-1-phosphate isomerase